MTDKTAKPPPDENAESRGRKVALKEPLLAGSTLLSRPTVGLRGLEMALSGQVKTDTKASVKTMTLLVNEMYCQMQVASNETLLETLRGRGNVEVKCGCEKGDCGACAVLVDGQAVDSCLTLTWTVEGCAITTIAGLGTVDEPHPLQTAFSERGAAQCGFCIPGMIIAAQSMLTNDTGRPTLDDIRLGLSGNLCRCTGYTKVFDAISAAAEEICKGGRGS